MAMGVIGGAVALVAGLLVPVGLGWAVLVTLAVCWMLTYARVLSQPVASTSVLILVCYFAGLGGAQHTLAYGVAAAQMMLLGGAWAMLLSLVLWPLDAFRPARMAVAQCYLSLAEFAATLSAGAPEEAQIYDWQRRQRVRIEEARTALSATAARAPSRTVRARNLTVLLETSDMLLARTMRLTEDAVRGADVTKFARWLAAAERAVGKALEQRPADAGESFAPGGSHTLELLQDPHATGEERAAGTELKVAFEALRTVWTGVERTRQNLLPEDAGGKEAGWNWIWIDSGWLDALGANWTMQSVNMRHALRLMVVGALDVLAMRLIRVNHGFWLPMTSIILMQPYSAGTNRKSLQRVTGTIAGGLLAAVLAASLPGQGAILVAITLLAGLTLATFAVDYAVYCFFLTPTFVLMSLPHPHDWRYAGIRIGLTLAGATIAIGAMRLLWPERAATEMTTLLRRGAAAEAAYLRAVAKYLEMPAGQKRAAERSLLAPARRACGLASNDAEEALDRVMQEPQFTAARGVGKVAEQALTFTTYLRRLTQSVTTLAGTGTDAEAHRLDELARRLEGLSAGEAITAQDTGQGDEQMVRLERQTRVLERTLSGFGQA